MAGARRFLLMLVAVLVVGGAVAYLVAFRGTGPPPRPKVVVVTIGTYTTNLADTGDPHYINITVLVRAVGEKLTALVARRQVAIDNAVLLALRGQSYSAVMGERGAHHLAVVLRTTLAPFLAPAGKIQSVLFTRFLVQ